MTIPNSLTIRTAGIAWAVVESANILDLLEYLDSAAAARHRVHLAHYAIRWANRRGLHYGSEALPEVIADARQYLAEHQEDLTAFLEHIRPRGGGAST